MWVHIVPIVPALLAYILACLLVQVCMPALAILLTLAKMERIPSFCPLSRFVLGASLANMALFRVLRGF